MLAAIDSEEERGRSCRPVASGSIARWMFRLTKNSAVPRHMDFRHSSERKVVGRKCCSTSSTTGSEYLYLVGDIVDGWRMKRNWYWRQTHNDVVQKILQKAGTRVVYIPGNHDEKFRDFAPMRFGRVTIEKYIHKKADGRRFLVMHGDQFDGVVPNAKWLARVGDSLRPP